MTDEERKLLNQRIDDIQRGLDLAIKAFEIAQRHQQQRQKAQRFASRRVAPPKKDGFDKFVDFITMDWLCK